MINFQTLSMTFICQLTRFSSEFELCSMCRFNRENYWKLQSMRNEISKEKSTSERIDRKEKIKVQPMLSLSHSLTIHESIMFYVNVLIIELICHTVREKLLFISFPLSFPFSFSFWTTIIIIINNDNSTPKTVLSKRKHHDQQQQQ